MSGTQPGGSETTQTRIAASVHATATTADCSRTRTEAKLPTATSTTSAATRRACTAADAPSSSKARNAPTIAMAPATTTPVASQRRTSLRTCAIIAFVSAPPRRWPTPAHRPGRIDTWTRITGAPRRQTRPDWCEGTVCGLSHSGTCADQWAQTLSASRSRPSPPLNERGLCQRRRTWSAARGLVDPSRTAKATRPGARPTTADSAQVMTHRRAPYEPTTAGVPAASRSRTRRGRTLRPWTPVGD